MAFIEPLRLSVTAAASILDVSGPALSTLLSMEELHTFTPKAAVDRAFVEQRLAEGLEDVKKGRVYDPFSSAKALVRSLHHESRYSGGIELEIIRYAT